MKKIMFLLIACLVVGMSFIFYSCVEDYKETKINASLPKGHTKHTYVLDTLDNGHIIMWDFTSRDYGFTDYAECPKCKENLKKLINEVLDERAVENMSKGY